MATVLASASALPTVVKAAPAPVPLALSLDEIVVTARRRAESLQEVPIAVTAFSSTALESIDIKSLEDIAPRTPGPQLNEQADQIAGRCSCSIRFRGMNANSEQVVHRLGAPFIDGICVAEDDGYEYRGSIGGPIMRDKLALRLSGRYYDRGNTFTSNFGGGLRGSGPLVGLFDSRQLQFPGQPGRGRHAAATALHGPEVLLPVLSPA